MPAMTLPRKPRSAAEKTAKISRWGNSLGLRIPQEGVDRLRLRDGESVAFEIGPDRIVIRRARLRRKWTEADLLQGVTPAMTGGEVWATPVGKEVL